MALLASAPVVAAAQIRGAELPLQRLAVLADLDSSAGPLRSMLDAEGRFDLPAAHGACVLRIVDVATGATLAWRLARHDTNASDHDFDLHLTELRVTVHGGLEARLRTSVGIAVAPPAELRLDRSSSRPLASPLSLAEGQTTFVVYLPAQPVIAKVYANPWHDDHYLVAEAELTPALGRVNTLDLNLPDK